MFSRVLGLVREQVFAILFGAGYAYDSFVVAFRIPNLLRDLFGEGALSAAFVSVFSDYNTNKSRQETMMLASNTLCFFGVSISILVLVGMFLADLIVSLLAPDFALVPGKTELTSLLTIIMMPFLLFVSLAAVVMGILNTRGIFFLPALSSSFFNAGSIITGTSLAIILPRYGYPAIIGMAIGTLVGGILQLAVQIPALRKAGFQWYPRISFHDTGLHRILKLMVPATIGLSATQINIFINTNFASSCAEGSVSWLNYAFRLVQLPIGLFGVAISIAALPVLASMASQKKYHEMNDAFISSLTMVFCLTIPATIGLIFLAEPIIRIIFEHGAFTSLDTQATAIALSLYAAGLFAYASNKVIVPVFYAINASRYPVIGSFLTIGANIIIILFTIETFQHRAIALSTSLTMMLNFVFLMTVLYHVNGGFSFARLFSSITKIAVASGAMLLLLYGLSLALPISDEHNLLSQILLLAITIISGAALYLMILWQLKLPEINSLINQVKNKLLPGN
ncbi:MAG: murein biosynthesis integral membrane protein MurJ [Desulfobulbaceae bacterium]|nr:MAG: murein biosynthesis integral membrane protein MurJ [Desulfobulbaceae bacterium]